MADRRMTQVRPLRFLFVGYCRDWNPLKGHTPPKGRVCELRSLPGNVVTWASSFDEAYPKLRRALEQAFKAKGSAVEWYEEATTQMTETEDRERKELWERVWKEHVLVHSDELPSEGTVGVVTEDAYHAPVEVRIEYASFVKDAHPHHTPEAAGIVVE